MTLLKERKENHLNLSQSSQVAGHRRGCRERRGYEWCPPVLFIYVSGEVLWDRRVCRPRVVWRLGRPGYGGVDRSVVIEVGEDVGNVCFFCCWNGSFFFFITWYKNIDLSSVRSCGIHRRTLSWEDRTISISKTRLKIPFLESHPDLPGANELSNHCLSNNGWLITTHDVNMDMIIYPCCKCFLSFISVVYFWYNQLWYVGVLFQFRTHQESHLVYPK